MEIKVVSNFGCVFLAILGRWRTQYSHEISYWSIAMNFDLKFIGCIFLLISNMCMVKMVGLYQCGDEKMDRCLH